MISTTTTSTTSTGSLSFGILQGELFRYTSTGLVAFESSPLSPSSSSSSVSCTKKCLILLGGLSDGLLPVPYTKMLYDACGQDWSLIQPILSSSYTGFGHGTLDRDIEEMNLLFEYLVLREQQQQQPQQLSSNTEQQQQQDQPHHHPVSLSLCLIGHSTGCQQIVHYVKYGKPEYISMIQYAVLQGPVSDREASYIPVEPSQTIEERRKEIEDNVHRARVLIEANQGEEMMPRRVYWAAITAQRYYDLHSKDGLDDYFSSDYTDDELKQKLHHIGSLSSSLRTCLVVWPGCDEYVPHYVDGKQHLQRLLHAMNHGRTSDQDIAKGLYLEHSNHNLSANLHDAILFIQEIKKMLSS